ncbi:Large ribosomal subunit protein uL29c-like protein [Drosera capensis]
MSLIASPAATPAATSLAPPRAASATHFPSSFSFHRFSTTLSSSSTCLTISSSSSSTLRPRSSVLTMAKREEELKEIRAMTTEEINEAVVDLKGEIIMLNFAKYSRQEYKPSEFRRLRKRIARMLTVKREREIEEGIGKRLSRKLDRKWRKSIVPRPPPGLNVEEIFPTLKKVSE